MKRKSISTKIRRQVYEKYGGRCAYCGEPIEYKAMQVDHMEPLAKGGADRKKNACRHQKGKTYGGKLCHDVLTGVVDAYEWSFVAASERRRKNDKS